MSTLPAWVYSPNPAIASPDIVVMPNGTQDMYFDGTHANDKPLACGDNKYGLMDHSAFADPMTNKRYLLCKLDSTNPGPPSALLSSVPAVIYVQELAASDYLATTDGRSPILSSANDASA